jgi:hypothetical protein
MLDHFSFSILPLLVPVYLKPNDTRMQLGVTIPHVAVGANEHGHGAADTHPKQGFAPYSGQALVS